LLFNSLVANAGCGQQSPIPEALLWINALTWCCAAVQAAKLAAAQLQGGGSGGGGLSRKQVARALALALRRQAPFPGLNAPLPPGADAAAWAIPPEAAPGGKLDARQVGFVCNVPLAYKVCGICWRRVTTSCLSGAAPHMQVRGPDLIIDGLD